MWLHEATPLGFWCVCARIVSQVVTSCEEGGVLHVSRIWGAACREVVPSSLMALLQESQPGPPLLQRVVTYRAVVLS